MKKSFPAAAEGRLLSSVDLKLLHTMRRCHESGLEGVVSLESRLSGIADSPETTPHGPGSNRLWSRPKACIGGETRRKRHGF